MSRSTLLVDGKNPLSDADLTPNPDRAIWVQGTMDEALLDSLRPRILELTAQSREPITVFINSNGGSAEVCEDILRLLRRTSHDDSRRSRIITVAEPYAASSAANLLSAGDFAIAHPNSRLLYHGARWRLGDEELTTEWARIAQVLPTFHETAATGLALNSARRFLFVVRAYREMFAQHRAGSGNPTLTDLDCFLAILRERLSPATQKLLDLAVPLWNSHNALLYGFQKRLRRGRTVTLKQLQKIMLNASIAFEYESNKGNQSWDGGLSRISDHFYFLNAYFDVERLREWVALGARSQTAELDIEEDYWLQFRSFFRALCRTLQEGENYVTAMDAVWLGLIDTVR